MAERIAKLERVAEAAREARTSAAGIPLRLYNALAALEGEGK